MNSDEAEAAPLGSTAAKTLKVTKNNISIQNLVFLQ